MICALCPRSCSVDRALQTGACRCDDIVRTARIALHHYEEPPISGTKGSGAVFFTGCNLSCVFCQNHALRDGTLGKAQTAESLAREYLSLQDLGAHNINLVTPSPHVPLIRRSLRIAKSEGLHIPVVYNTNAYELPEVISSLSGLVDIYLPDFKYVSDSLAVRFSNAPEYGKIALRSIGEMKKQVGSLALNEEGIAVKGLLIRHLVLPGCAFDSRSVLDSIADAFGTDCYVSIMSQYTPTAACTKAPLNRRITGREYTRVVDHALSLGFGNLFIQDLSSSVPEYTPLFFADQ